MAAGRAKIRNMLTNGGFYFYFSGGQWRYFYAGGHFMYGNPLSAPRTLSSSGEV
jgi:hypothetical protein